MKQLRARADFETARIQAFLRDAGSVLRGDTRPLLSFDEVRRAARLEGQSYRGLTDVPIADIRGSVGRPNDFDASFLPVKPQLRKRWEQLDAAMRRGEPVPPIEVYHLGNVYFVKDGHHRVSVARHLGWKTIPAKVIEVRTRAPLTGDMDAAALLQAKEYVDFLERTQLDRVRPQASIAVSPFETEGTVAPAPSPQVLAVLKRWLGPSRRVIELPARLIRRAGAPRPGLDSRSRPA